MSTPKASLVVVSKAKAFIKEKDQDASVGMEALAKISTMVEEMLVKAMAKAKADGRKVIKERDLE